MELIDKKALLDKCLEWNGTGMTCDAASDFCNSHETCMECIIDAMPLIDAVPVVRCRDCICRAENKEKGYQYCMFAGWLIKDDDFCSHAERLDEEVQDGTD